MRFAMFGSRLWPLAPAVLAILIGVSGCGPAPETNAARFETYRPLINAKKDEIRAILNDVPRDPHVAPIAGSILPRYAERDGSTYDTNIFFQSVQEFRTGEAPAWDLDFHSRLGQALDWVKNGIDYPPNEPVDPFFAGILDEAVATPFAAFYIIDGHQAPAFINDKTFQAGSAAVVVLLFDLKQKMVVASCRVQAASSQNLDFSNVAGGVSAGVEVAADNDLKRNARRQMAACLSEQSGGDLEVLD